MADLVVRSTRDAGHVATVPVAMRCAKKERRSQGTGPARGTPPEVCSKEPAWAHLCVDHIRRAHASDMLSVAMYDATSAAEKPNARKSASIC